MSVTRVEEDLLAAIQHGDDNAAGSLTAQLLSEGVSAESILAQICIPAVSEVQQRLDSGDLYVPDLLISLRAFQSALSALEPHLASQTYEQALEYGKFDPSCYL